MLAVPNEGAVGVELGNTPGWTNTEELLALIAETIDAGNAAFYNVHRKKGAPPAKPLKVTRPGPKKKRRKATSEDLVAMFGGAARFTGRTVPEGREGRP